MEKDNVKDHKKDEKKSVKNENSSESDKNTKPKKGGIRLVDKTDGEGIIKEKGIFSGLTMGMLMIILMVVCVTSLIMNNSNNGSSEIINTSLNSGTAAKLFDELTVSYDAAYIVDGVEATISSGTYESTKDNEVVFLVINGGRLLIDGDVKIIKTGIDTSSMREDMYAAYGINSAIAVVGEGSSVSINGATIITNAYGANGVMATNGGVAGVSDTKISTMKNDSAGLLTSYGGTIEANGVTITTMGELSPTLSVGRNSGLMNASDMVLKTAGVRSPLVFSAGNVTVSDSDGLATQARIVTIKGKNTVTIEDSSFTAAGMSDADVPYDGAVLIYQTGSNNSEGVSTFVANNCEFNVLKESSKYDITPFLLVTNTKAEVKIEKSKISFSPDSSFVVATRVDGLGETGKNGGKVKIKMTDTEVTNKESEVSSFSRVEGLD